MPRKARARTTQSAPAPRYTALVIAQDAFRDDRGRTHIIGIFDQTIAPTFPINLAFTVFAVLRSTRQGFHRGKFRVQDATNTTLVETDEFNVQLGPTQGHNIHLQLGVAFPAAGVYRVQGLLDGTVDIETPLVLR